MARLVVSLAGAAIGNLIVPGIGGQIGFALGSLVGNALFAEDLPPIVGPKIEDGKVSSSAYGRMIPVVWGTVDVAGNVIDAGPLVTVEHKEDVGGKGGPKQVSITYTQLMNFFVELCEPCDGIVRIYANERLLYDATPGSTIQRPSWLIFKFFDGSEDQEPDSAFEALHGVGNLPAYRGTSGVAFWNFLVSEFGTTAINFRFVVTSNGTASTGSTEYDQGGAGIAPSIVHNTYVDLMIGSIQRDINVGGTEQMLVAIEPYSRTEAWRAYINDADTYGKAHYVMSCGFQVLDEAGQLVYPPDSIVAVYHQQNVGSPQNRFIRFFFADSGIQFGLVPISTSESTPKIISAYRDDAVFYQRRVLGAPTISTMRRHAIDVAMGIATVTVDPPAGYDWYGDINDSMWVKPGMRIDATVPVVLATLENSTSGAFGFVTWEDNTPGFGAGSADLSFSTPDELDASAGQPAGGVYDPGEDCFWVLSTDSDTHISRVELDGSITSTTDWDTAFSITGAAASIAIDTLRDMLWVVIGGVAYSWPTYDSAETPTAYGSGLEQTALSWHPYTGTLFAGDNDLSGDHYFQYQLSNLSGGGVSLQQVVEDIIDYPGTNLTTADRECSALSGIVVDGFRLTNVAQRRAAIDTLRKAYLFDLVPRNGVLTAVLRGGASSATLGDDQLGAHLYGNNDAPPRLRISRESEDRLPSRVGVSFIDASQNYEEGYEPASRLASQGGTELHMRMPVVMSHDEAAQLASVHLHSRHIEAERYEGYCMPSQRAVAVPAAVITAEVDGISYPMRLESANIIDGGIVEISGVRQDTGVYTDYSVGGIGRNRERAVDVAGATQLLAMDLPALREADLPAGYYVAATTYAPTWPGAVIYESSDGTDFTNVVALNAEATEGYLTAALPDGNGTDLVNTLSVRLVNGSLSSLSDAAMQTDKISNYAAVGASGRWEILRFQNVAESGGIYSLTTLLRGLRDTIGAIGSAAIGDRFVLLSTTAMRRIAIAESTIGDQRWLKAVTIGRSIGETTAVRFSPIGRSLRPFRPACLDAQLSGSDWTITWSRQDRKQARFLQQPQMSESAESYSVQILDYSGNVIRTISASSETATYTSAMQTSDFGGVVSLLRYQVAQISSVVGAGPYTAGVAGSYSTDYDALVTARSELIDFWPLDETSGTTAASDSGSHDGAYTNSPTLNSTSLTQDGAPSVRMNATGNDDRIQFTPGAWSAAIRAVDFVIMPNAFSGTSDDQGIVWASTSLGGGVGWAVMLTQAGKISFRADQSDVYTGPDTQITCDTAIDLSEAVHVQINFGDTLDDEVEIRIDGIVRGSGVMASSVTYPSTGYFRVGGMLQHLQSNIAKLGVYNANLTAYDAAIATISAKGLTL